MGAGSPTASSSPRRTTLPATAASNTTPRNGGPAYTDVTGWIEREANTLLQDDLRGVRQIAYEGAVASASVHRRDYVTAYVDDLGAVIDMEAIHGSGLRLGVDPLGGASLPYWQAIA